MAFLTGDLMTLLHWNLMMMMMIMIVTVMTMMMMMTITWSQCCLGT